jgi:hypothetical protein
MFSAIPYLLLILLVTAYLAYRRKKYGRVILKVDRVLFSPTNTDVFLSLAVFAVVCVLFIRYDLKLVEGAAPWSGEALATSNILFYVALFLVFAWRQMERPVLREYGISSPRGNWRWEKIASYRWAGETVMLQIAQGKRTRTECWLVPPQRKKELTDALKNALKKSKPKADRK